MSPSHCVHDAIALSVPPSSTVGSHAEGARVMLPERHYRVPRSGKNRLRRWSHLYNSPRNDRRRAMKRLLVMAALCGMVAAAQAQKDPCAMPGENSAFLGIATIRLWPGEAPQAKGTACEDTPTLTIFDPQPGHDNGSAVVVLPGGAYAHLAANLEGRQVADWFTARGFRAFVLSYRLSSNGYLLPVPLLDAQRAMQTVRARANDYHVNPNRIVIIGFSAGGHLAALAATQPVEGKPEADDPIERVSSRPDFLVLGYPWIGAISSDTSHFSYCKLFNVMDKCEALRLAYSQTFS